MKKLTIVLMLFFLGIGSVSSQGDSLLDENLDTLRLEGLAFVSGDVLYASESANFAGNDFGLSARIGKYATSELAWYLLLSYNSNNNGFTIGPGGLLIPNIVKSTQLGAGVEHYKSISGSFYFTGAFQLSVGFNNFPGGGSSPSIDVEILQGFRYQLSRHFALNLQAGGYYFTRFLGENPPNPASTSRLRIGLNNLRFGMDYLF